IDTVVMTSIVLFLVGASSIMSWVMAYAGIPQAITTFLLSVSDNPIIILLFINIILLVFGTFMYITHAILLFNLIFYHIAMLIVLFLVGASSIMSWVMAYAVIPQAITTFLLSVSDNPIMILLLINIILLVVGTFMDITPAILIFTPIFYPIAMQIGLDPVHFG